MSVSETLFSLVKDGFDIIISESLFKDPLIISIEMSKENRCIRHSIDYAEMSSFFNPDIALTAKLESMADEFKKEGQAID